MQPRLPAVLALAGALLAPNSAVGVSTPRPQTDLDDFMRQVLASRDENWKKLQQYVLDESERVDVRGPAKEPIWGERREYAWFIRSGYFVRSPVSVNGVTISEDERRQVEDSYLRQAKRHDARGGGAGAGPNSPAPLAPSDGSGLLSQRRPPAFIEAAYFLRFKFEQGTYALVGHEQFDGQDVLRIEYYPTHLFSHETNKQARERQSGTETRDQDLDATIEQMMNKVSLVTVWVEPAAHQIVKYTFDNVNFDFFPASWLVRVTDARASMSMSQPFKGVWLPKDVDMVCGAMIAIGDYHVTYHVDFHNYREATTTGRVIGRGGGR